MWGYTVYIELVWTFFFFLIMWQPVSSCFTWPVKSCLNRVAFPWCAGLLASPVGSHTHTHTYALTHARNATWNFCLFTAKGTRNCATKPPAVLQVWTSDSSSAWLIALKSGTSPNKMQSQWLWQSRSVRSVSARKKNVILFREKKKRKRWSWGQRADRATDLSQMCISETTGEHFPSTFGKNFVLSCSH